MSAETINDLLNSLEQTIHERFRMVNQLLASKVSDTGLITQLLARIEALEKRLEAPARQELLPASPMVGLEVSRKTSLPAAASEKVITVSMENLVPTVTAEAEVELYMDNTSVTMEVDAEEEVAETPKVEAVMEVEEEAEEAVELEEFEYKGATYYRDSDNNVFTTDEDGELNDEPFGLWNEAKQRIVARR